MTIELEEEFLDELRDFLTKWNAEIEANVSPFGYVSLRYFVVQGDKYFDGVLPHVINADTNLTAKKENHD